MVMGSSVGSFDSDVRTTIGPIPVQVEVGDFDQDGDLDLAILSVGTVANAAAEYGQSLYVLPGNGAGGFTTPFVIALKTAEQNSRFAVGDFNGDGWDDLGLLEPDAGRIRIALNTQGETTPSFEEVAESISIGRDSRCFDSADFTGDGKEDFVVALATDQGGRVDILASDGSGGTALGGSSVLESTPSCIRVGRIDDDDTVDVALGGMLAGGLAEACVLLGKGNGEIGEPVATRLYTDPTNMALGNLDGKGHLDLVLTHPESDLLSSVLVTSASGSTTLFLRSDANGDGAADISDVVDSLDYLFLGGGTDCLEALDVDDNATVDITDPIYLLNYLFAGGPEPLPPFPAAGEDPGGASLSCQR